jgi:hypothetical protein
MTPAERLTASADLLDKRASEATEGPWKYMGRNCIETGPIEIDVADWGPEGHEGLRVSTWQDNRAYRYADAVYIATMHPEVGKALAKVLRSYAEGVRELDKILTSIPVGPGRSAMLDLADLLLAGAS